MIPFWVTISARGDEINALAQIGPEIFERVAGRKPSTESSNVNVRHCDYVHSTADVAQ